jgi:hypothetical protein
MNRPLAGVVLLVLAVVAVTVIPMINGRRVAGSGAAVEFPAPPQVGDCVVPPFPADNVVDRLDPEVRVTAIKFGPCTGAKFGEVVALSDANTIGRENSRIPSRGVCSRQIAEYAGLTTSPGSVALPGESTSGPMAWMPTIGSESYLIVPSLREQSAGHNWVACLAAATNQHSYQGSLRAAYTTGALPDQFGLCWTGADLDLIPGLLACDQPHAAELLATGWIGDRSQMPRSAVDADCRQMAGLIMRTGDPTRGGAITVVLDPVRLDGATRPTDPLTVGCLVTASGTARLTGTVIGLGDRPAPVTK